MAHKTVIIDCDPGIDDAFALMLALNSPEALEVIAITTVGGNKPLAVTTGNALRILEFAGRTDIPVHAGAENPLIARPEKTSTFHGSDGLGNCGWPDANCVASQTHAAIAIIDAVMARPPGSISLCALAPLTNIALALTLEPRLAERLEGLWIMGGSIDPEEREARAEFNFLIDPHAAHMVLASRAPIRMFGLNATEQAPIAAGLLAALRENPATDTGVLKMLAFYAARAESIHDVCALAALIAPDAASYEKQAVSVECQDVRTAGQCRISKTGPLIEIANKLDNAAILALTKLALTSSPSA